MAMLAEPRRRQKLSFDPRNKAWSDDSTKFGQKLMEKMGWSKGKGLGAKEDGNLSHVKVSLKNNTLGVGCKASQEDNWIAHQDDFNDLLSSLNQNHTPSPEEAGAQSLEERTKKSKNTVRYRKFIKGKDLKNYGKEGMNSILGKRLTQSAPVTPETRSVENSEDEEEEEEKENDGDKDDHSHGVVTFKSSCHVGEYFAQKMSALKRSRKRQESESHSDTELEAPRCGFGFSPLGGNETSFTYSPTGPKSEQSNFCKPEDIAGPSEAKGQGSNSMRDDIPGPSGVRTQKKPGKGSSGFAAGLGFVSSTMETGFEVDESFKNGRKEEGANEGMEEEAEMDSEEIAEGNHDRSRNKKKKKRKKKKARSAARDSEGDDPIEVRGQSENEEDEGIDVGRKKKKNKKKKRLMDEMVAESKSESAGEQSESVKRKKKLKKSKKDKLREAEHCAGQSCSQDDDEMVDTSDGRSGGETSKRKRNSSEEGLSEERDETNHSRKKRKKEKSGRGERAEGEDGEGSSIRKKKKKKQKM